jgi:hypothetical protein
MDNPLNEKKNTYEVPRLTVYGDLRLITETMRRSGMDTATSGDNFLT